uniref:FYVE-type domain-containing protein n=1 Tax=Globisporangium ultimum (strain ATCC 200006 / CBS 805.95 / DAOM BR144) TaxID=431595 RepID=K3X135_GLOUD
MSESAGHNSYAVPPPTAVGADPRVSSSWRSSSQLFPTIHLTKEEQIHYDVTVGRVLQRTLTEYENFRGQVNKDNWELVRKRKQMSIYRNLQGLGNPRVTLMMGTGLIPGTVEEVMDGLYSDNTDDLRAVRSLIRYKFVDGGVFHVCESRTPEAPYRFAGIKWTAAKAPLGGTLIKNRDLLTYERMGMTTDANGNEIAYHILQSINRPEWPADCIKNIRRAYTSTCYLFRRRNNVVECFLWGEYYANGHVVQKLADYGVCGLWMNVLYAPQCSEAKRLTQLMARATPGTISLSGSCDNCHQRPGYFDKLRPCAGCRQRICKGCTTVRKIFKLDWYTKTILTEKFCLLCVTSVTNRSVTVPGRFGDAHSVSSTSDSNYGANEEYEGNERVSKLRRGPTSAPQLHNRTTLTSTFQSSAVGNLRTSHIVPRPSSLGSGDNNEEETFELTEANLRNFELGMSMVERETTTALDEEPKIVGPEDISTNDTEGPIMERDGHDRYFVDMYTTNERAGRASV